MQHWNGLFHVLSELQKFKSDFQIFMHEAVLLHNISRFLWILLDLLRILIKWIGSCFVEFWFSVRRDFSSIRCSSWRNRWFYQTAMKGNFLHYTRKLYKLFFTLHFNFSHYLFFSPSLLLLLHESSPYASIYASIAW